MNTINYTETHVDHLASLVIKGDRRTLAICISLIESKNIKKRALGDQILKQVQQTLTQPAIALRIGIAGITGAGKSTLINALGTEILQDNIKLAVLTIDPSSIVNGGSLLGDAIRMGDIASHPQVFLRSTPSGTQSGGIALATSKTIQLCEAAGFNIILVESLGSGQIEFDIRHTVDFLYWLTLPGAGDDVQAMKQGVLEWVDGIIITQADSGRELLAKQSQVAYQQGFTISGQRKPVLIVSSLEPVQVSHLWRNIQSQILTLTHWSLDNAHALSEATTALFIAGRQRNNQYRNELGSFEQKIEQKVIAFEELIHWLQQYLTYSCDWLVDFMPQFAHFFGLDTVQINWQGDSHIYGEKLTSKEFSRLSLILPQELHCQFDAQFWREHNLPIDRVIFIPLSVVPTNLHSSECSSIFNPVFRYLLGYRYCGTNKHHNTRYISQELMSEINSVILFRQWARAVQAVFFEAALYALQQAIRPKKCSLHDELTGLANRDSFCEHLDRLLVKIRQNDEWVDKAVYVYGIDIDGFRRINEVLGLEAGDNLLCLVADVLSSLIGSEDILARFGGDEFFLCKSFLIEAVDETDQLAKAFGDRLLHYLNAAVVKKMPVVSRVQCHIGCVALPDMHTTANQNHAASVLHVSNWNTNEILRAAGAALFAAKSIGPDDVYMYDARMRHRAHRQFAIKNELFQALAEDQFTYLAQPLINQRTKKYIGAELLLRWQHPSRGILAASEFIESATGLGILQQNDLRLIFKDLNEIIHIAKKYGVIFHLNLSAQLFFDEDIIDFAIALEKRGALPYLHFEITEHAFVDRLTILHQFIYRVRAGGSQVWLDDFGVGYSGLRYLDALDIDGVKIDQSFISRSGQPRTQTLLQGIMQLISELKLSVLAEGVENEQQALFLTSLGCDLQQGLFHGVAMPLTDFVQLLEKP